MGIAGNKLFCTFTSEDGLDSKIEFLATTYTILFNKIFVLSLVNSDELICTYNIDTFNSNTHNIPENTILVHRKKESNTLYTINGLNELIKALNGGIVDTKYPINWSHYKNTILLTQHDGLKQFKTKIYKIIEL